MFAMRACVLLRWSRDDCVEPLFLCYGDHRAALTRAVFRVGQRSDAVPMGSRMGCVFCGH